ncbi:MAG TPA: hypothetical protein VIJ82_32970, partial [Streptosporangiaceae bacterium]
QQHQGTEQALRELISDRKDHAAMMPAAWTARSTSISQAQSSNRAPQDERVVDALGLEPGEQEVAKRVRGRVRKGLRNDLLL